MQAGGDDRKWGYRPYLDGIRAIAVYLVVAFHSGADRLAGGFIGVDVFFVLSGYLVTHVLIQDLGGTGIARLGRFYSRRVRRLIPAAVINLAVTVAVVAAIESPARARDAMASIRAAAFYVSNWHFISQSTDYFAADINTSPVIHYWSLSAEEQFYLLWPLLLAGIVMLARRAGPRERLVVRWLVVGGGLASLVAALLIARTDPTRAYFGTDTRAYQLLAGAALALSPAVIGSVRRSILGRALPLISVGCIGALVLLATTYVDVGPVTRGVATTAITVALIVSLEAADGGVARRGLSGAAIVYLGRISYGTYLWHWLVILVIRDLYGPSPFFVIVIAAVVATGIASLSFQVLENPIRIAPVLDRFKVPVIAIGLSASLVVGIVFAPRILDKSGADSSALATFRATNGTPNNADWQAAVKDNYKFDFDTCDPFALKECVLAKGKGEKIAIVGDSHATMLTPMIIDLAHRRNLSVSGAFVLACPWTWGILYAEGNRNCFDNQDKIFNEVLPKIDPDIVVLVSRPVDDPRNGLDLVDQRDGALTDPKLRQRAMQRSIDRVVRNLRTAGRKVVIVEPIPVPAKGDDPLDCLSQAKFVEQCRFVVPEAPTDQTRIIRNAAKVNEAVWSIDLGPLVCPYLPICDPVVNGLVTRPDDNHLTVTFARTLLDPVTQFLLDNGVLAER